LEDYTLESITHEFVDEDVVTVLGNVRVRKVVSAIRLVPNGDADPVTLRFTDEDAEEFAATLCAAAEVARCMTGDATTDDDED
jgi:hypothetical protein